MDLGVGEGGGGQHGRITSSYACRAVPHTKIIGGGGTKKLILWASAPPPPLPKLIRTLKYS